MDDDLYTPPSPTHLSRDDLQDEIALLNGMIRSLDPKDPLYDHYGAYYQRHVNDFEAQLSRCPTTTTAPSYPPSGSSSANINSSVNSYKRELDPHAVAYPLPSLPVRPPQPPQPLQPQISRSQPQRYLPPSNFVDLTSDDQNSIDPFAELDNVDLSNMEQHFPPNFNQPYMNTEEVAQYLLDPSYPNILPMPPAAPLPQPQQQHEGLQNWGNGRPVPLLDQGRTVEMANMLSVGDPWDNLGHDSDDYHGGFFPTHNEPEAVQDLIENIRFDQEVRPEQRQPTPMQMKSTLMEHQKIALTWLLMMERSNSKGGILADEMGLGKTVQAIALILANPSTDPLCKTTLIVAPVALMRQWEKEIERHVKPHHRLKVHIFHGQGNKISWEQLRMFDVVLTTYGTLASQFKEKEKREESENAQREGQEAPNKRRRVGAAPKHSIIGRECMWYRIILDEAQCIKNRQTVTSKAASDLQSRYRLAMTGTPMMNSVDELFSLVRFLKIPPYHVWNKFNTDISLPLKKKQNWTRDNAMQRVQALLKSIMLRRCKNTLVDGKEICQIPPKQTLVQEVKFSQEELSLYKAVETQSRLEFNKYLEKGTVNNNYANILVMLLRLRQICCHPHLVKDLAVQASTENISKDELMARAETLSADVVNRLRVSSKEGFECPICYETEVNPTIFVPCGHTCCGECFQKLIDPARAIREGVESNKAKCPECREILSSEKITDFIHFCRVHFSEMLESFDLPPEDDDTESDSDSEDDSDDPSDEDAGDEVDKNGNLKDFVVDSEDDDSTYNDSKLSSDGNESEEVSRPAKNHSKNKGKGKAKAKPKVTLAQLKKESLRNRTAKKKYLKRLRKQFQSSAKIDKTMELLSEIKANDPKEKTLIFSQFTSLLDLLEVPLQAKKVNYQRYDGSMSMNDRAEAVNLFMDNAEETVFLISLKAGNAGLNLNKASQVIILDPFWNPFVEDQAIDRAHRMPQKREVKVHRILVPETVEDRICALQDKKRDLINTAMDEGVGKQLTRLTVGELQYLFGLGRR
ncbi:hypothetical protein DM02DRAFT_658076 [Periconia macrospinosa]|uniref:SWI/SNF family DNA-dependent ATPase Ris1 n=1 Tax=Periconia macrospinosa TaxID=97972 RepID=A0A2V1DKK4_9PLEO|nr:hypothetical protein DM02DRAFT_658076 [Periconia macrospinosa]